ncbi:hypothetical protein [Kitasatospora sp. NRRL B-11411]|uniref:hypothetical protein n=1 Tax=Kitasatospora sp. NRRL B-11411 TaxID=1463822 RepID=UPI0004C3586C|nr:hypothetical protein [Kitasatospora sp. NRRL B-11411]
MSPVGTATTSAALHEPAAAAFLLPAVTCQTAVLSGERSRVPSAGAVLAAAAASQVPGTARSGYWS